MLTAPVIDHFDILDAGVCADPDDQPDHSMTTKLFICHFAKFTGAAGAGAGMFMAIVMVPELITDPAGALQLPAGLWAVSIGLWSTALAGSLCSRWLGHGDDTKAERLP